MKKTCRIPYIAAGIICAFASGLLFTWSYWRAPLNELFPTWTTSDLSAIFSFHNTVVCVAMIVAGWLSKKLHVRVRMIIGAVLTVAGLGLYPLLPLDDPDAAYRMAFVLFSVVTPVGAGIVATSFMGNFVLWVPERPGLMSGAMLFLYYCSPFIYGALSSVLIPAIGILNTIAAVGAISGVLVLICLPFCRPPRPEDGLPAVRKTEANRNDKSYTTRQMLCSPIFWAIFLFGVAMRSAGLIYSDHSANIALSFGVSGLFGLLYSPANGCACFVAGALIDKLGSAKTMRLFSIILGCASVLLFISGFSGIAIVAFVGLIGAGFAFGGTSSSSSSTIRIAFGPAFYTQNYSTNTFAIFFASIVCYLGGLVVEWMGGSYYGVYTMTLVLAAIAFLCTIWLRYSMKKRNEREAAEEATAAN